MKMLGFGQQTFEKRQKNAEILVKLPRVNKIFKVHSKVNLERNLSKKYVKLSFVTTKSKQTLKKKTENCENSRQITKSKQKRFFRVGFP